MDAIDAGSLQVISSLVIQVRWSDLDAFNHVNNAVYLRYLEEARVQWLESIDGVSLNDRIAPVLAASQVNYRRSIGWPNHVLVELLIEKIGNRSLTMGHRIVSSDDPAALYADGSVVMVWIDTETGNSVPLPDAVRIACAG